MVASQKINPEGGDASDPGDDITQFTVGVDPNYPGFTPVGGIIMWAGLDSAIASGWALCNGQIAGGKATPNLTDRFVIGKGSNSTGSLGEPTISGATDGKTLGVSDIPRHQHGQVGASTISIRGGTDGGFYSNVVIDADSWTGAGGGGSPGILNNLNDSNSHSHGLSSVTDVKPKWYALAFIMRFQ